MYMAQEAAAGRIIGDIEDGETLPQPSPFNSITPEKPEGFVSLVYIDIDQFKAAPLKPQRRSFLNARILAAMFHPLCVL
jgi:hypothetical protein